MADEVAGRLAGQTGAQRAQSHGGASGKLPVGVGEGVQIGFADGFSGVGEDKAVGVELLERGAQFGVDPSDVPTGEPRKFGQDEQAAVPPGETVPAPAMVPMVPAPARVASAFTVTGELPVPLMMSRPLLTVVAPV